jgi:hypothetical protein
MLAACQVDDQVAGGRSVGRSGHLLDVLHYGMCDESKSVGNALNYSNAPLLGCFQIAEA